MVPFLHRISLFLEEIYVGCEYKIAETYFGLKYIFGIFKSNIRIEVIYNDAHVDRNFIKKNNKHSA